MLPRLKREVIDIEVEISFKGRASKTKKNRKRRDVRSLSSQGRTPKVKETFRLVGVRDKESKTYHLYLNNTTPEQLPAEDVARLYIELVFKELKRLY